MIIYNVTTKVDHSIADEWVQWILHEHAPALIATRCFTNFTLAKLIEADDKEGSTYAVQYFADTIDDYTRYKAAFATALHKKAVEKWGNRFISFSTLMEIIN